MTKQPLRLWLSLALCALVGLAVLTACGGNEADNATPPPATIIRAEEAEPTLAPIEPPATATPLPEPPTRLPEPTAAPQGTPEDYPVPPTMEPLPTVVYPTPAS
jgi:hypothetical protein